MEGQTLMETVSLPSNAQARLVPWFNWAEWEWVYSCFFQSGCRDELRWLAIKRVSAWRARGKVPHAIEATAQLVEISLKDRVSGNIGNTESEYRTQLEWSDWNVACNERSEIEKRMLYSLSLIRFVNGMVEPAQKGAYASSISQIAESMGLDKSFVELRHEATHSQLPSLHTLRAAAKKALEWLFVNYWQKQKNKLDVQQTDKNTINIPNLIESVTQLLGDFRRLQKSRIKSEDANMKTQLQKQANQCLEDIVNQVPSILVNKALVAVLVNGYFLVPKSKTYKKRDTSTLPARYSAIWNHALKKFNQSWKNFVPALTFAIVQAISQNNVAQLGETSREMAYSNSLLVCWLFHVLKLFLSDKKNPVNITQIPLKSIVHMCLNHYSSQWMAFVLEKLLNEGYLEACGGDKQYLSHIKQLIALKKDAIAIDTDTNSRTRNKQASEVSLEELEAFVRQTLNENYSQTQPDTDIESVFQDNSNKMWTKCTGSPSEWNVPIGVLPNRPFLDLSLPTQIDSIAGAFWQPQEPVSAHSEESENFNIFNKRLRTPEVEDLALDSAMDIQGEHESKKKPRTAYETPSVQLLLPVQELLSLVKLST